MNEPAPKVKGLGSLFRARDEALESTAGQGRVHELALDTLRPGKYQPRSHFDEEALHELAASILATGVLEPILVRPVEGGQFEIIAGERRWRASKLANKATIPAIIKQIDDSQHAVMALIENIQREDLAPMEEAQGIHNLMTQFNLKQKEVADLVGKKPKDITNLLNLLKLPECLDDLYAQGTQSPEIHSELMVAYKEDSAATEQFVRERPLITRQEARAFKHDIKNKNSASGISQQSSPPIANEPMAKAVTKIILVFRGEEAILDLYGAESEFGFCWIYTGDERRRVRVEELQLRAVL